MINDIKSSVSELINGIKVYALSETDSTNNEAKREIAKGNIMPSLYLADSQTAGRGRMDRSFYSPKGEGIYMSLALPWESFSSDTLKLTPLAALSVCRAIETFTDKKPMIKWVNDIYLNDKKVCGILTESVMSEGKTFIIIGIGINVNNEIFPEELKKTATSLNCNTLPRAEFIACIVNTFTDYISNLCDPSYMDEYKKRSLVLGKDITYIQNGITYNAKALFIDDNGALHVTDTQGEEKSLSSGEITVRI